jgi:hypothetical protein
VNEVILGGGSRVVTVKGIPTSVVKLVHASKFKLVTDEGIPAYDVMFGGAPRYSTVEGMFAIVVIEVHLDRYNVLTTEGKFANDFRPGAFILKKPVNENALVAKS